MDMKIKFWGTRGSLPTSTDPIENLANIKKIINDYTSSEFYQNKDIDGYLMKRSLPSIAGYGGSTICVQVESLHTNQSILIDGGSGIQQYANLALAGPLGKGKGVAHIFMTHFHWDHLIGLPFFVPLFIPGNEIHFYAVQTDLEKNIRELFKKPNFPVPFEKLGSKIYFHTLEPRSTITINDIQLTPYLLDHPDPCWGYRVQVRNKVYAHCVDTEGTRISQASLGPDLQFYQQVDLMCYDAQYSLHDLSDKIDWGHSAAQIGLDLAMREGIKRVLFVHHDPHATTEQIENLSEKLNEYYEWQIQQVKDNQIVLFPCRWEFGYDGQVINL